MNDDRSEQQPAGRQGAPADLRRHPRVAFVASVEIAVRENDDADLRHYRGQSTDISLGGMFVASPAAIPLGVLVRVDVYPAGQPPMRLYGRVVHVREGGFGCIFTRVPRQAQAPLQRWLGRSGGLPPVSGIIGDGTRGRGAAA